LIFSAKFLFQQEFYDGYDTMNNTINNSQGKRSSNPYLNVDLTKIASGLFHFSSFNIKLNVFIEKNVSDKSKETFCRLSSIKIIRERITDYNPDFGQPLSTSKSLIESYFRDYEIDEINCIKNHIL